MAYRTHKAPLQIHDITDMFPHSWSSKRTLQRDLQHLQALRVTWRYGGAQTCKWSFTEEAHTYFEDTKRLANREFYDLNGRPGYPGQPIWRLHPIMEEMIRRMITGMWAEELTRMEETRDAAVDRYMKWARDAVREPKDNGKFG